MNREDVVYLRSGSARIETTNAYQIAVGNGVHFGGGMKISPDAGIDDGLLDISGGGAICRAADVQVEAL